MSAHRAERRRAWVPVPALVAGAVGLTLVAVGTSGTFAAWTDRATVSGDGFASGRLDLTVDGGTGAATSHARTDLALPAMVPGESTAATIVVGNAGDADLTWTATTTRGGDLGPALSVELWLDARASGDDTTYPRTEGCSGGSRLSPGTAVRTNRGLSRNLCVLVTLPTSTDDSFQGRTTGSVRLVLDAAQVVSP